MTDKIRGSDQLKLNCASFSALTQEELMQVAGGLGTSYSLRPFPQGQPWPDLFVTLPQLDQRFQTKGGSKSASIFTTVQTL